MRLLFLCRAACMANVQNLCIAFKCKEVLEYFNSKSKKKKTVGIYFSPKDVFLFLNPTNQFNM